MKKILIILYILCCFPVFGANFNAEISKIENNLFGFDYTNDTEKNRIERLEKTVYGKAQSGDIKKRIKKLSGDISADVIGLEIPPSKDTFLEDEKLAEDTDISYPIVEEIEQMLFNKTYPKRDFHTRIVTIEKKLFGKIYDVDDYSTRMDRIKEKMMPQTIAKKESKWDDGSYYDDNAINSMDLSGIRNNRFSMPFGQRNYSRPYSNYGGFSEEISDNVQLNDELSQMEYDMFGTEFSNESKQSRIKRLNSVNKAKKSAKKYDSQKFSQHMSTAMEIGAMILMVLAMIL